MAGVSSKQGAFMGSSVFAPVRATPTTQRAVLQVF